MNTDRDRDKEEENQILSCQMVKENLDDFMERVVDMRIAGESEVLSSTLAAAVEEHLLNCPECLNYKLANSTLLASAAALPSPAFDEALTMDIMAAVRALPQETALQSTEVEDKIQTRPIQTINSSQKSNPIMALLASFALFAVCLPLEAGDNMWSVLSWALALVAVLMLEPLLRPRGAKVYA